MISNEKVINYKVQIFFNTTTFVQTMKRSGSFEKFKKLISNYL